MINIECAVHYNNLDLKNLKLKKTYLVSLVYSHYLLVF
jgi:hypothetical protein